MATHRQPVLPEGMLIITVIVGLFLSSLKPYKNYFIPQRHNRFSQGVGHRQCPVVASPFTRLLKALVRMTVCITGSVNSPPMTPVSPSQ